MEATNQTSQKTLPVIPVINEEDKSKIVVRYWKNTKGETEESTLIFSK